MRRRRSSTTSGTTGSPRAPCSTITGSSTTRGCYTARLGLEPGKIQLSAMALFHTAGCVMAVLGAVVTRGTLILPPYFDPVPLKY